MALFCSRGRLRHTGLAQAGQMQALPRAAAGMLSRRLGPKSTCVHQHGGCSRPLARCASIAHAFALPHKGQSVASSLRAGSVMPAV